MGISVYRVRWFFGPTEIVDVAKFYFKNLVTEKEESIDGRNWKSQWVEMGIGVGHYWDSLHYSKKSLMWAHKVDPNSSFRRYTLYSVTGGNGGSSGPGEIPNLQMALRYVQ